MSGVVIATTVICAFVVFLAVGIILLLSFIKAGPQGPIGPVGSKGSNAVPVPDYDLLITTPYNIIDYLCRIEGYDFYDAYPPGNNSPYDYNQLNIIFKPRVVDVTRKNVLTLHVEGPRGTNVLGITNTTNQVLYLNLLKYSDINLMRYKYFDPRNGGTCKSTVDDTGFTKYTIAPMSTKTMIMMENNGSDNVAIW